MHQKIKVFEENVSVVCNELHLAKQWGKAIIILTVHKSIFSQEKLKTALKKKLNKIGYKPVELNMNQVKHNVLDYMVQYENRENVVFYISNIGWGGGKDNRDGYRILNLYREVIIEKNLKTIFFLTLKEASNLPGFAPDFWAFRHHVLEFKSPHSYGYRRPPVGLMAWHRDQPAIPNFDADKRIVDLMKMLDDIGEQPETVALRLDLYYELGFLLWRLGDYSKAKKILTDGVEEAKTYRIVEMQVKLQNGLAIVFYEQGEDQLALQLLASSIKLDPKDFQLHLNQAILLFAMKKRYKAISKGKKALSFLDEQTPWAWNSLGFLYYFAGNVDDAVICFKKAKDLSPQTVDFVEALSIAYLITGLSGEAQSQLQEAQKNLDRHENYTDIIKACIEADFVKASSIIKAKIDAKEISKLDLVRNPLLNSLMDICHIRII